jgi:hypothetical protein
MRSFKTLMIAGTALVLLGQAGAEARPKVYQMSCAQAQSLVQRSGAVVVDTSPTTFRRVVSNRSYCDYDQRVRNFYTRTRDVAQCAIGFECFRRLRIRP